MRYGPAKTLVHRAKRPTGVDGSVGPLLVVVLLVLILVFILILVVVLILALGLEHGHSNAVKVTHAILGDGATALLADLEHTDLLQALEDLTLDGT